MIFKIFAVLWLIVISYKLNEAIRWCNSVRRNFRTKDICNGRHPKEKEKE